MPENENPTNKRNWTVFLDGAFAHALVAVSAAEEEVYRMFKGWAEARGWSAEEIRKVASELSARLSFQRRELERKLEDSVRQSVLRVRIPKREEIELLRQRLHRMDNRINALTQQTL